MDRSKVAFSFDTFEFEHQNSTNVSSSVREFALTLAFWLGWHQKSNYLTALEIKKVTTLQHLKALDITKVTTLQYFVRVGGVYLRGVSSRGRGPFPEFCRGLALF